MRAFSDDFLERYLDQAGDDVLRSVGAYRLEGLGAQLFERVTGDFFTILGLPLLPVLGILREHGHGDAMSIQTLTGKTRIAGIFGWPVDHSRSPRLHGYWLEQPGIDGAYIPFATHPSKLEQGIRALPALGFRGGNITLPHKERALGFVDELTPVAKRIGAINMLVVREDGSILGDNSDGFGFIANLQQFQPSWRGAAGPAVLLGAGGAARAIVVSLLEAGVPEIRLVNRTTRRAEEFAEAVGGPIKVLPWDARADALKDAGAAGQRHHPRHGRPAAARNRPRDAADQRRGLRHRLRPAADRVAQSGAGARQQDRRRHRHAPAPGPPGLQRLVRRGRTGDAGIARVRAGDVM